MISPFIVNDKNLFLSRFPAAQVNRSLQAWDSADEYLINYIEEQGLINANTKVAIFNDAFGALATNFCHSGSENAEVVCINDSYISSQGISYNIEQNYLINMDMVGIVMKVMKLHRLLLLLLLLLSSVLF